MSKRFETVGVLEHNQKAAAMWSGGGRAYDAISRGVSEGIRHAVGRLAPQAGERIVDIATGTGWTAREVARSAAIVTGVDIASGLLDAARGLAEEEGLAVDWRLGDAEQLPFADAAFDAAISTFGIMFAGNQEAVVQELTRIVCPGGRIAVLAWSPNSNAVALRQVVSPFMAPPLTSITPLPSPFNWGDPVWLNSALGEQFALGHESAVLHHRLSSASDAWSVYSGAFPPVQAVVNALDSTRRDELRSAFEGWVSQYATDLGIAIPYEYTLTLGTRR